MPRTRYGKKGIELDDLSAEDLLDQLADYLLHSGFADGFEEQGFTLDDLRQAIERALHSQAVIPLEELERLLDQAETAGRDPHRAALGQLVDRLLGRLVEQGYLSFPAEGQPGRVGELPGDARFEITDRGLDFLGFRALRETLSRAARRSFGRHETDQLSTGVDAVEAPKPYEFGDSLNLDGPATILEAVKRQGARLPLALEEADLRVRQAELNVSSATVLLLDCSHSMVLYGEDRFTPAKRVALGLAHLIRTRYPGDELQLVLFHDSAEEVPMVKLPRVQIGPWHTNTAAGLKLARLVLGRSRREMKSIVLITDGKPSALTLPDGRIYKNSFGLDPLILQATFDEVAACRRSGIHLTTFMIAHDRPLVAFVKKATEIARGKAYFTSPRTLGQYVTVDFLKRKTEILN